LAKFIPRFSSLLSKKKIKIFYKENNKKVSKKYIGFFPFFY